MNVPVTQATDGYARRVFTVRDVFGMLQAGIIKEDERFELIEGEIVPMSPKGNQHEVIKSALNRIIASKAPEDLRLGVETTVYLSMTTFVEPDLCLYPKRILPEDVRGLDILLAIEVAVASLGYDKRLKAKIYATAFGSSGSLTQRNAWHGFTGSRTSTEHGEASKRGAPMKQSFQTRFRVSGS
jgi:hypothetical protein